MLHRLNVNTAATVAFQDITDRLQDLVAASRVKSGLCHVYVPHTTAGIMINEHADPSVVDDIAARLDEIVPQNKNYRHLEGNSPAHIKAVLTGDSRTLFIEEGRLVLGTWQGVFFCEFDGPRHRSVIVKITADVT